MGNCSRLQQEQQAPKALTSHYQYFLLSSSSKKYQLDCKSLVQTTKPVFPETLEKPKIQNWVDRPTPHLSYFTPWSHIPVMLDLKLGMVFWSSTKREFLTIILDGANEWYETKIHHGRTFCPRSAVTIKNNTLSFFFFQDKVFVTFLPRTANYTKVWTMLTLAVIFKGMLFINAWKLWAILYFTSN